MATQYLPDQAGFVIMQTIPGSPATTAHGAASLVAWTALALAGGYLVLRRWDA